MGKTLEKMLQKNNGLTVLNTVLLAGCLYFCWDNSRQIVNIRHALYYRLQVNPSAPDYPSHEEEHLASRDLTIPRTETKPNE